MNSIRKTIGRKLAVTLAAATVIGLGATGCSDAAHEEDQPKVEKATAAAAAIDWGNCPALAAGSAARNPKQKCGTIKVPLNYQDAGGAKIDVAVSELSSAKSGERRGVLVLNPGGPAIPGLDMPSQMISTLPAAITDHYDLVGFDPRGVGHSTPQSCGIPNASVPALFPYPAADGSITANITAAKEVAQKCASADKDLKYYTTANTARDLDQVRAALGQKKISYWGQSYGTYLGAVYRALFPGQTDRMILEGNVDPTQNWAQDAVATWAKGMADRFPDAAAVAAAQDGTLGLGSTVADVTQTYLTLADQLDRQPAPVPGTSVSITGADLRNLTYGLLLHNETLTPLVQSWKAIKDLAAGSPTAADAAVLKQALAGSPATPGVPADNQVAIFLSLTCGDSSWSTDMDEYATNTAASRKEYPLSAGMPANVWPCAFWPAPVEKPVTVTSKGGRNVLILQNKRDNATPWESAEGLRKTLGQSAAFVGVDNGGHYVYNAGSKCADQATVNFLANGSLPSKDLYCTDVS